MSKPLKVVSYDDADIIVESNFPGEFFATNHKTGKRQWASTASEVAEFLDVETYAVRVQHRCEGPGCDNFSKYKYCPYCHFQNRKKNDKSKIGILGM